VRLGAAAEVIVSGDPTAMLRGEEIGVWYAYDRGRVDPVAAVDGRTVESGWRCCGWLRALRHRINMQVQVAIQP